MRSQSLIPMEIFKTDIDKHGNEILKMSDFYGDYFNLSRLNAFKMTKRDRSRVNRMVINDVGLMNELILYGKSVLTSGETLIADMDSLPLDIKEKLEAGIYKIAESKQVDGNMRAVIFDEHNVRIKDITLKLAKLDPISATNFFLMLQLRNLQKSIDDLASLQKYSISIERRQAFITPFFEARSRIVKLQESGSYNKTELDDIHQLLEKGRIALYGDMVDLSKALLPETEKTFISRFKSQHLINEYSDYLLQDLQLANKYFGVHMQLLDSCGRYWEAEEITKKYEYMLKWFFDDPLENSNHSLSMIIQGNCKYDKTNLNRWYNITKEVREQLFAIEAPAKNENVLYLKEEKNCG